jgi:pilus assembly protein CpaB
MRHRTGLFLILGGIILAGMTTMLVMRIANQATEAGRSAIRQVNVVMTNRDILDQALITADALVIKTFPADFAPVGALGSLDQVVGKFARGFIAKDQVLVAGQIVPAVPSTNLSDRVPPGKVAVWLPMPELLGSANVLKAGDRLDILLTVKFERIGEENQGGGAGGGNGGTYNGLSTQTTLQNVEVFRLGLEEAKPRENGLGSPTGQVATAGQAAASAQTQPAAGSQATGQEKPQAPAGRVIGFLVDHQDALMIKFIKDSGGTIDVVLRSTEEQQIVRTEAVTQDVLVDRFRFRVPLPIVGPTAPTR